MNTDLEIIKLMQHFSNALKEINNGLQSDARTAERMKYCNKAQEHLKKFDKDAELLLNPQPTNDIQPQLHKADVSGRSEQLPQFDADGFKRWMSGWVEPKHISTIAAHVEKMLGGNCH